MIKEVYQEALDAYANPLHEYVVKPITSGLINQSFKVTSKTTGDSFLLQNINQHVFSDPEKVQYNYETLWKYLQSEEINFIIPEPKYFPDNNSFYCDSNNNYWRVFEYIDGAITLSIAEKPSQAKMVAETFGSLTACFSQFDAGQLNKVIPGFHNLSLRFKQFKDSLHSKNYERIQKAAAMISELKEKERYANFFDVITESEEFPLRVMHHDAKISNILFDEETGKVICTVDFDTIMPGYFFSDLGDMIRSMVCPEDENSTNFDIINIRKEFYDAIVSGYMDVIGKELTESEKKHIHYSGLLMIYMQSLRFLADFLNGDIYYRIDYPEQNFDRAKNQLILLQRLEDFLGVNYQFKI